MAKPKHRYKAAPGKTRSAKHARKQTKPAIAVRLRKKKNALTALRVPGLSPPPSDEGVVYASETAPAARPSNLQLPATASMAHRSRSKWGTRRVSKQAMIIGMLHQPDGTTIAAIMGTTGWQRHSVRGFFARVVRKRFGLNLVSDKTEQGRIYRIATLSTS